MNQLVGFPMPSALTSKPILLSCAVSSWTSSQKSLNEIGSSTEKLIGLPFLVHLPLTLVYPSLVRIDATLAASPVAGRSLAYWDCSRDWSTGSSRPLEEVAGSS